MSKKELLNFLQCTVFLWHLFFHQHRCIWMYFKISVAHSKWFSKRRRVFRWLRSDGRCVLAVRAEGRVSSVFSTGSKCSNKRFLLFPVNNSHKYYSICIRCIEKTLVLFSAFLNLAFWKALVQVHYQTTKTTLSCWLLRCIVSVGWCHQCLRIHKCKWALEMDIEVIL